MVLIIHFYRVNEPYGCFSNFSPHPIRLGGKTWPTSEHYFQAQKFKDPKHQEEIRKANSPMLAARLGLDRKKKLRRDWESVGTGMQNAECRMQNAGELKTRRHRRRQAGGTHRKRQLLRRRRRRQRAEYAGAGAHARAGGIA